MMFTYKNVTSLYKDLEQECAYKKTVNVVATIVDSFLFIPVLVK